MFTAESVYGTTPQIPSAIATPIEAAASIDLVGGNGINIRDLVDPRNPLVIFGVILAITFGAVGVAGSARIGGAKASGKIGSP
jgi:hypothetical protein